MAKIIRYSFYIYSVLQRQRSVTVAEIVKTHLRDTYFLCFLFELFPYGMCCYMPSKIVCKNKIVIIVPTCSSVQFPFCLFHFGLSQHIENV